MASVTSILSDKVVRDAKTGRAVTVRGFGALKGQLALDKSIDLTKPIAAQVMKLKQRPTRGADRSKP